MTTEITMDFFWILTLLVNSALVSSSSNKTNHALVLAKLLKCNESLFDNVAFPEEDLQYNLGHSATTKSDKVKEKTGKIQAIAKLDKLLQNETIVKGIYENYKKIYRGNLIKEFENENKYFKTFSRNTLSILRFNTITPKPSFDKGINQFTEITAEELAQYFTGFKPVPPNIKVEQGETLDETYEKMPPAPTFGMKKKPMSYLMEGQRKVPLVGISKDWRKVGAVSEVKDQRTCGASTLFAAAGALESSFFIWRNGTDGNESIKDLSTQQLLDCIPPGEGHLGCGGNFIETTLSYMQSHGVGLNSLSPYQSQPGTCNEIPTVAKVKSFYRIPKDERAMKIYMFLYGPIIAALHVTEDLLQYSSGAFSINPKKCAGDVNHAVLLVGHGMTDPIRAHWIAKSSWGPKWGEEGYFRIAMHQDTCSISNYSFMVTA